MKAGGFASRRFRRFAIFVEPSIAGQPIKPAIF